MSSRSPILDMKHKLAFGMAIPCRRNDFHTKHATLFLPLYCVVFFLQAVSSSFFLRSLLYAARIQLLRSFKQDCIPVGCVPPARWPYLPACSTAGGDFCSGGWCLLRGGVCSWGRGCLLRGVSAPRGGLLPGGMESQHALRQTPPREQNHTRLWKHNLAPTSLRAVKMWMSWF